MSPYHLRVWVWMCVVAVGCSGSDSNEPMQGKNAFSHPELTVRNMGAPEIAVWFEREDEDRMAGSDSRIDLIMAVWRNGYIIWSGNRETGGAPYYSKMISPELPGELLSRLKKQGVFEKPFLNRNPIVYDASYHVIYVSSRDSPVAMTSSHEFFETNPLVIGTSKGISALEGMSRQEALKNDTEEYREFRRVWDEIRADTKLVIPEVGIPLNELPFQEWRLREERGRRVLAVSWKEPRNRN